VIRRDTAAFDAITEFWRVPVGDGAHAATLAEADAVDTGLRHSLVHLRGDAQPGLHRFDDGGHLFAAVTPIAEPPDSLEVIARITTDDGEPVSYIMEDPNRRVVYVPFSPSEAVRAFQREEYVPPAHPGRKHALSAYYALKRVVPRSLLMAARSYVATRQTRDGTFPRWPLEPSLDDIQRRMLGLLLRVTATDSLPFVWFWPHGLRASVTLTHDVEGADGRDMIERFIALEAEYGLTSSFNLVPHKYEIAEELRRRIEAAGCEVGVHGWDHQGSLVADRATFLDRAARINEVARNWGVVGFRSPSTYRNADWFQELDFEYDSSFPDTDPYEPQSGGCLSIFPFAMGNKVELPITMPQDHTQFRLLNRTDASIWRAKADDLVARNGLVCMLTHPDTADGYAGSESVFEIYREMLGLLAADDSLWHALPRDVARWWRDRARTRVLAGDMLAGPCEESGTCARAHLRDGRLVLTPSREVVQVGGHR
jgi:peptidoglycan/xylan/chitin deacetylase (PgdA/CDA1 family)